MKLPASKVKAYRAAKLWAQEGRCALTGYTLSEAEAVADHCHKTGHHRAIIHRGVNALLGKIENNAARYGVTRPMLFAMARNLEAYLSKDYSTNPLHSTYFNEDEKRLRRNAARRKKNASKP